MGAKWNGIELNALKCNLPVVVAVNNSEIMKFSLEILEWLIFSSPIIACNRRISTFIIYGNKVTKILQSNHKNDTM